MSLPLPSSPWGAAPRWWSSLATVLLVAVAATGCATIPQRPGFPDVARQVDERTGLRIEWDRQTQADGQAHRAVRELLEGSLTAAAAEQVALLNNQRLQALYAELGVARAALVQAGLLHNPVFDGDAARVVGAGELAYEAAVVTDFLEVLYVPLRRRLAASEFEEAKWTAAAAAMDLALETRSAFIRLQAAEQMLEMRRQVLVSTEASLAAAQGLLEAGNVTSLDVGSQRALLDQARLDVAAADAAIVLRRERLNRLMGLWGDDVQWQAAPRLPEVPSADLPPGDLEAQAVARSIDLALARQRIESAGRRLGLTKTTALVPELHLGPQVVREEGDHRIGAVLELPLPLFDRGQARAARDRAALERRQAEYVALAVEIRSLLRAARQQVHTSGRMARYYRDQVLPLRRQITRQTLLQYNAMQLGVLQLLIAKEQEIDAGRRYIESLRNYWLARARMEQLLRGRVPPGMADLDLSTPAPMTADTGGR